MNSKPTNQKFTEQRTTFSDATFSETIGLAMHNAITNQQQSQVTTAATVANTCAKLLAAASLSPT
ncbi:TPA: RebB family R body protein [Vibrio parahaemolyticus]|uniref:RebB family R body protein n=1 Tax=Vibrio parahaemolyticus TaxID=670 RepID=UPI0011226F1B|nr:RebB family R body protein [Vibrio parahaemolyticus]TOG38631.1 hypothetical protein CGJ02_23875 [Vibrio parahaemolyticus]HBN6205847.1 RebB family R body protein [Vibrio parahaemolyticus]HCH4062487.1 RebB family R body protein [Vibrio parahaemolyticus]